MRKIWSLKAEEEGGLKEAVSLFDNWTGNKEDLVLSVGDYFWSVVPGMTEELWEELEREAIDKGIFTKGGYMNIREYIREEARREGRQEGRQQIILNMLAHKVDMAFICKMTGLSEKEIKKLQNKT